MTPITANASIVLAPTLALALAFAGDSPAQTYVPTPAQIAADSGTLTDASEIIVLTEDAATMAALIAAAEPLGYTPLADAGAEGLGLVVRVLRIRPGLDGPGAIAELEALTPGVLAGVNHAYQSGSRAAPANDPRRYADLLLHWPEGGCTPLRAVGVVDAAPPSDGRTVAHRRFARGGPVEDDHGWLVADLVADPRRLPGAELHVADVVETTARGGQAASVDAIVGALSWLQDEGVRVVNISLAGPYNKILDRTFARAAEQGMLIVAAVGNDGPESPPRFPAAFPGVIAVTAVDADAAPYSRAVQGAHIDVAAPGVDIFVGERFVSGSSFAAPFVTAALAAMEGEVADVDAAREAVAARVRDLGDPGHDPLFGAGLLDLTGGC
ncbi:MAG: S8 family serine peptidase [Pseudomonadota bacterium]